MSTTSHFIETNRLLLRKMVPSDADFIGELLGDADVMRFYPQFLIDQGPESWIDRNLERYSSDGIGSLIATRKVDGAAVGQVGLVLQDVNGTTEPEVGYILHRSYWGNGYATEAAAACVEYGLQNLPYDRIVALIRPDNRASQAVAERLGMVQDGQAPHADLMHWVYATIKG